MIKVKTFLRHLLLSIVFIPSASIVNADNILSPEQVYDLAFSNCNELESSLKNQSHNIPPFDKLKLAENLSKIITLKIPSSPSIPGNPSAPYNSKSLDVSLTLNPNSENQAKECAIKNLTALLPESVISIPSLILASKDTSLPRFLKVIMLEKGRLLAQSLTEPMKDYTQSALSSEFRKNKTIFGEETLIPTLLPILPLNRDFFRSIALEYQSIPLMTALRMLDPKGEIEAPELIKELLSANPSLTKIFILRAYSAYPEKVANLLEVLPAILNNLTSSETGALLELISKMADNQLNFFPEIASDALGDSMLHLIAVASEKQKSSLAKTARALNLNNKSSLCTNSELEKEQSSLTLEQQIYLACLCSQNNSSLEILNKLKKQKNLDNMVLRLALISKNDKLRNSYLLEVYKELGKLKSSITSKERRNIGYYILNLENQNTNSSTKLSFSKLAEELISEEPSYPSSIGYTIVNHAHPSIVYFTSLGRSSIKPVSKLLKNNQSNLLRKQGLLIVSSTSYLAYPDLFPLIENLLADKDLEIRRLAYQTLSKKSQKFPSTDKRIRKENSYSKFYGARLNLQFASEKQAKEKQNAVLEIFTSIPTLNCQEASVPLNFDTKDYVLSLPPTVKEDAEGHLIECLRDKGPFGKRSISTIELLSPLSEKGLQKLEQVLANEKFPQLSTQNGIKYLSLLYPEHEFPTKLPLEIASNFFTSLSLKDQASYADWLTLHPFEKNGIEKLINTYFDQSVRVLAMELLSPDTTKDESEKEIRELANILDRNGQELYPLAHRLPETIKKKIISFLDSQTDIRFTLDIKSLLCPYLPIRDCNITIKPSLEYTLENPVNTLKEIAILLDRRISDSADDQLLLSSAIEYRVLALIQQGNIQALISSKLSHHQFIKILENIASSATDPSLVAILNFISYSMAPTELVR